MIEIERVHDRFQGINHGEIPRKDLLNIFIDAFDTLRYSRLEIDPVIASTDSIYNDNEMFWHDARTSKHFEGMRVALKSFHLTEWLPASPGRYFTTKAVSSRQIAKDFKNPGTGEYNVLGKLSMILGGVGSIRLLSKDFKDKQVYFLGASSTGISHQGIPIVMSEEGYRWAIQPIKESGGCLVDLVGTIQAVPALFPKLEYNREIPKYCILIEDRRNLNIKRSSDVEELRVTTTITFSRKHPWRTYEEKEKYREIVEEKAWSFCSFNPHPSAHGLEKAVEWLTDYAIRYSGSKEPLILTDFDEHYDHFQSQVELPIAQLSQGIIDMKPIRTYAGKFGITIINVVKEVVMGDKFENIHHATIVNRSVVQNAFNKVKAEYDEETAIALKTVADEIERLKNKEAAENFNSFNEELQKPEPKKSVLRTLWAGVTTTLPSILQMTDIVAKISKLFTI